MAKTNLSPPGGSSSQDTGSVTILIADDDEFFRMALSTIVTKTFTEATVVETSSLDEALERLAEAGPVSLALFDLSMPGMESAASLRAVRECFPHTRVAVVSASTRRADILLALEAGAHGYIPKGFGVSELVSALEAIRSGMIYIPSSVADLNGIHAEPDRPLPTSAPSGPRPDKSLTNRQWDVLEQLVQGKSNKEIARVLNLGEGTVKVHIAALFRSLGVTSRSAAAAAGMRLLGRLQDEGR